MPSPSFVQAASVCNNAANPVSISLSTTGNVTAGNYIVVFMYGANIAGTIADSQGNTYSFEVVGNGLITEYHTFATATGPFTVTFTFNTPAFVNDTGMVILEYTSAAQNILDQLSGVSPGGNISDFGLCPATGSGYVVSSGSGTNLSAIYAWQNWIANTAVSGSNTGTPVYFLNNLTPQTLEGEIAPGVTGAIEPAWISAGDTNDNGVTWRDSTVALPDNSIVVLGLYGDAPGPGTYTITNPAGWTLRTSAAGLLGQTLQVWDRAPEPFISQYNISVDKTVDNFDLAAQLAQVTAFPFTAPITSNYNPNINTKTLPFFQLPFCVTDNRKLLPCQDLFNLI